MLIDVFSENQRLGSLFLVAYFSLSVGFCLLSHSKHFGKIVFSKDALLIPFYFVSVFTGRIFIQPMH